MSMQLLFCAAVCALSAAVSMAARQDPGLPGLVMPVDAGLQADTVGCDKSRAACNRNECCNGQCYFHSAPPPFIKVYVYCTGGGEDDAGSIGELEYMEEPTNDIDVQECDKSSAGCMSKDCCNGKCYFRSPVPPFARYYVDCIGGGEDDAGSIGEPEDMEEPTENVDVQGCDLRFTWCSKRECCNGKCTVVNYDPPYGTYLRSCGGSIGEPEYMEEPADDGAGSIGEPEDMEEPTDNVDVQECDKSTAGCMSKDCCNGKCYFRSPVPPFARYYVDCIGGGEDDAGSIGELEYMEEPTNDIDVQG